MLNFQDQQITPHAISELGAGWFLSRNYFCSISPLGAKVLWRELADKHADEQMVRWATATVTHDASITTANGLVSAFCDVVLLEVLAIVQRTWFRSSVYPKYDQP